MPHRKKHPIIETRPGTIVTNPGFRNRIRKRSLSRALERRGGVENLRDKQIARITARSAARAQKRIDDPLGPGRKLVFGPPDQVLPDEPDIGPPGAGRPGVQTTDDRGDLVDFTQPTAQPAGFAMVGPGEPITPSPGGADQGPFPTAEGQAGIRTGQDPLSQLLSGGLQNIISNAGVDPSGLGAQIQNAILRLMSGQGLDPSGLGEDVTGALSGLIERRGATDGDAFSMQAESLRERLERSRITRLDELEGRLGQRGLLSLPGVAQGAERTGLEGLTRDLAGIEATALRDFAVEGAQAQDERFIQSLGLGAGVAQTGAQNILQATGIGAGVSQNNVRNVLAAIGLGTERQVGLSRVAIESLNQNRLWNQFLAQFGLDRELAGFAIQRGRIQDLIPLLLAQFQGPQIAQRGFV